MTVVLHSSSPDSFLNCYQALIHWFKTQRQMAHGWHWRNLRLSWCNVSKMRNWHTKIIYGTCRQSSQRYNFLVTSCRGCFNRAWLYRRIKDTLRVYMIKGSFMGKTFLTCGFSKWLQTKSLSSHNFMEKELVVIEKLLLIITMMVYALETMNQLKNGFSAQDVRFGSIATVSLIAYGRCDYLVGIPYMFLTVFLS